MVNDENDNEIPIDIPDEIEQQAEDILEEMDSNLEEESSSIPFLGGGVNSVTGPQGDTDFSDGFGSQQSFGMAPPEDVTSLGDMLGGEEMLRGQKIIHALQNEPEYLVKTFGAGVVLNFIVLHGGRKLGVSDYTLGTVSTALNRQLIDWMLDNYEP